MNLASVLYVIGFFFTWILVVVLELKDTNYPDSFEYAGAAGLGILLALAFPITIAGLVVIGVAKGIIYISEDYNREELAEIISKFRERIKDQEIK